MPIGEQFILTNITSAIVREIISDINLTFVAGGGNNMYIDDINIYQGSPSDEIAGISEGISRIG